MECTHIGTCRNAKIPVCRDDRITIYEMMYELTSLSNGRSLGIPGILFLLTKSTCVSISLAMYEYACTCSNDMMNHYNKVGVQKWSDLIAYGISRDEFNTVDIDEIVNVILYAYQGIRMWSRIIKMSPVVFDSITNHIRKQLVKE